MKDKKQIVNELIYELYVKKYKQRINLTCTLEDEMFKYYMIRDWRLKSLYGSYVVNTKNNISISEFYDQEIFHLQKFVMDCILNIPKEVQPEHIYIDEKYPYSFEIIIGPDYEEFVMDIHTKHMQSLNHAINYLKEDEIRERLIEKLKTKIKIIDDRIRREQENKKNKKIYKYDKTGEMITIYDSRKICCENEGIKKAALSLHLNGKRKTLKGYIYKEIEQ